MYVNKFLTGKNTMILSIKPIEIVGIKRRRDNIMGEKRKRSDRHFKFETTQLHGGSGAARPFNRGKVGTDLPDIIVCI